MSGPVVLILRFLAAAALYVFLGWTLYLMWKTLNRQASSLNLQQVHSIKIHVNTQAIPEKSYEFMKNEVVIGRNMDCECLLSDTTVSAYHARLLFHHGQWWVEDLGSKNGTLLNDEKVLSPAVIVNGDTIKCGQTDISIKIDSTNEDTE